jgi:hypothetical protein
MVTTTRSAMLDLANNLINEGLLAKNGQLAIPAGMTQEAYVADRHKKARTILDLMMEKLPIATCPFTVQMGEQVAYAYYNLGKEAGDSTCIDKGNQIIENEILRYGSYVRFYQSLDASKYATLTNADKFIDQQYLLDMLGDYGRYAGDKKYQELMSKLSATGVNMDRLQAYQEAYERSLQQQVEAQRSQMQAQQAQQQESSAELEDILGN